MEKKTVTFSIPTVFDKRIEKLLTPECCRQIVYDALANFIKAEMQTTIRILEAELASTKSSLRMMELLLKLEQARKPAIVNNAPQAPQGEKTNPSAPSVVVPNDPNKPVVH
jgi:hypothetical protein